MLRSSVPPSFPLPFGADAGASFIRPIPAASQIGVNAGAASLTDGFVPLNFLSIAAGGIPPSGQDMNGILKQLSQWCQWLEAGGPASYDPTFSAAIGGYPQNAVLCSAVLIGRQWVSLVDGNTTDPDSSSAANWAAVGIPVGTPVPLLSSAVPWGFTLANGLTIGNASSNATGRANADAFFLFVYNWTAFPSSPIFDSTGNPSTRGASAAADFAANKALATPSMKGAGLIGADTMGGSASTLLAGVPVVSGNTTTPGSVVGENGHTLVTNEVPVITPAGVIHDGPIAVSQNAALNNPGVGVTGGGGFFLPGASPATITASQSGSTFTGSPFGGGASHNNVERSMIVYWGQKL